jgi:hypothetical protein
MKVPLCGPSEIDASGDSALEQGEQGHRSTNIVLGRRNASFTLFPLQASTSLSKIPNSFWAAARNDDVSESRVRVRTRVLPIWIDERMVVEGPKLDSLPAVPVELQARSHDLHYTKHCPHQRALGARKRLEDRKMVGLFNRQQMP